jgi:hypothetical protein
MEEVGRGMKEEVGAWCGKPLSQHLQSEIISFLEP